MAKYTHFKKKERTKETEGGEGKKKGEKGRIFSQERKKKKELCFPLVSWNRSAVAGKDFLSQAIQTLEVTGPRFPSNQNPQISERWTRV